MKKIAIILGILGVSSTLSARHLYLFRNASDITQGTVGSQFLDSSSITKQGNTFNGATQLVQTDSDGFVISADVNPSSVTKLGQLRNGIYIIDEASATFRGTVTSSNGFVGGSSSMTSLFVSGGSVSIVGANAGLAIGSMVIINQSGNIGLGALIPSSRVDVLNGSITIRGTNAGLNILNSGGLVVTTITLLGITADSNAGNGTLEYRSDTGELKFKTSDTWTVLSTASVVGGTAVNTSASTQTKTGGLNIVGSVGIGTTNPTQKFQINGGTTGDEIWFNTPANSQSFGIQFVDNGTRKWQMFKDSSNNFGVYDSARTANVLSVVSNGNMSLMPNGGNIGIGTTDSSSLLDVSGGSISVRGSSAGIAITSSVIININGIETQNLTVRSSVTLPSNGVTAGTYGGANVTVNSQGLIVSIADGPGIGYVEKSTNSIRPYLVIGTGTIPAQPVDIATNTRLAFEIAFASLGATGGTIFVKRGLYYIRQVTVPPNVEIIFESSAVCHNDGDFRLFEVSGTLRNFQLQTMSALTGEAIKLNSNAKLFDTRNLLVLDNTSGNTDGIYDFSNSKNVLIDGMINYTWRSNNSDAGCRFLLNTSSNIVFNRIFDTEPELTTAGATLDNAKPMFRFVTRAGRIYIMNSNFITSGRWIAANNTTEKIEGLEIKDVNVDVSSFQNTGSPTQLIQFSGTGAMSSGTFIVDGLNVIFSSVGASNSGRLDYLMNISAGYDGSIWSNFRISRRDTNLVQTVIDTVFQIDANSVGHKFFNCQLDNVNIFRAGTGQSRAGANNWINGVAVTNDDF